MLGAGLRGGVLGRQNQIKFQPMNTSVALDCSWSSGRLADRVGCRLGGYRALPAGEVFPWEGWILRDWAGWLAGWLLKDSIWRPGFRC